MQICHCLHFPLEFLSTNVAFYPESENFLEWGSSVFCFSWQSEKPKGPQTNGIPPFWAVVQFPVTGVNQDLARLAEDGPRQRWHLGLLWARNQYASRFSVFSWIQSSWAVAACDRDALLRHDHKRQPPSLIESMKI